MSPIGSSMSISRNIIKLTFFYLKNRFIIHSFLLKHYRPLFCEKHSDAETAWCRHTQNQYRNKHQPPNGRFHALLLKKKTETTECNKKENNPFD